jgi:hypothetical protein
MKILMVLLGLAAVTAPALAAELNLNGGESAIIEANTRTRVTCAGNGSGGGGGGDCAAAADGFRAIMDACLNSWSASTCVDKYWPKFKQDNPNCKYAGVPYCLEICKRAWSGSTCIDKCN